MSNAHKTITLAPMSPAQCKAIRRIIRRNTLCCWTPRKATRIRLTQGSVKGYLYLAISTEYRSGPADTKAASHQTYSYEIGPRGGVRTSD